jgi:hypothetical protein
METRLQLLASMQKHDELSRVIRPCKGIRRLSGSQIGVAQQSLHEFLLLLAHTYGPTVWWYWFHAGGPADGPLVPTTAQPCTVDDE